MDVAGTLSDFLRTRRDGLRPGDVALPVFGGTRRVAGLRREEIAHLAGVSVDYYTRLEQGRVPNPSVSVLDAVAGALRLNQDETQHLYRLARPRAQHRSLDHHAPLPATLVRLLAELNDVPSVIMGERMDILAWNCAACSVFGDYAALPPPQRNIARITFLDPASRDLYADWEQCARENVAYLRLEAGRRPLDHRLTTLIDELSAGSAEFRRWWAEHPVQDKVSGVKRFHHAIVGELELTYETLRTAGHPELALITYTAEPGTTHHSTLKRLLALRRDDQPTTSTWPHHSSAHPTPSPLIVFDEIDVNERRLDGIAAVE